MPSTSSEIVTLCVGGQKFQTTLQTLTSVPDSVLCHIFSGAWTPQKDAKGRIFIDRNGTLFEYILDFLRDGPEAILPDNKHKLLRLKKEADYFGLQGENASYLWLCALACISNTVENFHVPERGPGSHKKMLS